MERDYEDKHITEYWVEHYCGTVCTLCGNSGIIDTTNTAVSAIGVRSGRRNWCICPNGQCLRAACNNQPVPDDELNLSASKTF